MAGGILQRWREAWRRLRGTLGRDAGDRRLDEEMRFHLDMQAERNRARGMAPQHARRAAAVAFGPRQQFAEEAREESRMRSLEELVRDIRHAARALRRAPGYTAAVVGSLALGLGATTVVFSFVDHIVLRPLPYPDPDRLVLVREVIGEVADVYPSLPANASHFLEWRREARQVEQLGAIVPVELTLSEPEEAIRVSAVRMSPNLFPLLGAEMQVGRRFSEQENEPGRDRVIVLSDGFWRRRFGGDPGVIGRSVTLNDVPYEIVGVAAPDFALPAHGGLGDMLPMPAAVDLFRPLALTPLESTTAGEFNYAVIGRLAPGTAPRDLEAEVDRLLVGIAERLPEKITLDGIVMPLADQVVGGVARPLLLLLAAVGAVLLIVCVNLANLSLARNAGRAHEAAVRAALGAGRRRLARLVVAESLLLAVAGGLVGLALARAGLDVLVAMAPASLPRLEQVTLDLRVVAVAFVLAVGAGLSFGIVPALRQGRTDPGDALKEGSRSLARGPGRGGRWFIAAQVAAGTVLLVATGLFVGSLVRVLRVDRGFEIGNVLAMNVVLPSRYSSGEARVRFYDDALDRLGRLPGVTHAALSSGRLPLEGDTQVDVLSREHETASSVERPVANIRSVSPRYFPAIGTPLVEGRIFDDADRGRSVVVLSASAAAALWPGETAIGKRVMPGSNHPVAEVVGVVADVRTSSLEQPASLLAYLPYWQASLSPVILLMRTAGDPAALTAAARGELRAIDAMVPITRVRTIRDVWSDATAARRFVVALLSLFAAMALVTATIGIFGVIAGSVERRTAEIGMRMALGARPVDVQRMVLREGLVPVGIGLGAGIAAALVLGRSFASLLYSVRPGDPATLLGVAFVIALAAIGACAIPARRATRRDLAATLRSS